MITLKVAVILVTHDAAAQPYTVAEVRAVMDTADRFYRENSYGKVGIEADVFGWYVVPMDLTVCDIDAIRRDAKAAAAAQGADLASYQRFVFGFPQNLHCKWAGFNSLGDFLNGRAMVDLDGVAVAHELGHSFGLAHAMALDCGAAAIAPTGTLINMGDQYDLMAGRYYHFNAYEKDRLGWLAPHIVTVSGVYTIAAYETDDGEPKAIKIPVSQCSYPAAWSGVAYYVEARRAFGFDWKFSNITNVMQGVLIHLGAANLGYSIIVNTHPEDIQTGLIFPALNVGQSFADPVAGITVKLLSSTPTSATVEVTRDAVVIDPPPPPPPPSTTGWTDAIGKLIVSGTLLKNAPQPGTALAVQTGVFGATQTASADFTSVDNNLGPRFGIVLRYQNPLNYYLAYRQTGGSSRLLISKIVNGGETILKAVGIANPAKGSPFKLAASATGTALALDFNGVQKFTVSDATFAAGGVGIVIGNGKGTAQHQADHFASTVTP